MKIYYINLGIIRTLEIILVSDIFLIFSPSIIIFRHTDFS